MRVRLVGVTAASLVLVAVLVWTGSAISEPPTPVAQPIVVTRAYTVDSDRVRPNETLSHLFARHGISGPELLQLLAVSRDDGLNPRRIRATQEFEFRTPVGWDRPDQVRTRISPDGFLVLARARDDSWLSTIDSVRWVIAFDRVTGSIETSLNAAIHAAVNDDLLSVADRQQLVWNTAENVYGWVIDFTRDPRPGDTFTILYERATSSAGEVRIGRVLSARMSIQGEEYTAYAVPGPAGQTLYYDAQGRSLHRAFLMYPVAFRRISSTFQRRRFHPVLRRYRAHLGYDFAADTGTPIVATGDGTVRQAGQNGGLGISVSIRHAKGIETRYGHMTRVASGIRPGVRTRQGDVIGYVGMTGLATGPHVHYEFLKNGSHVNYRNVDLGDGVPIGDELRPTFERIMAEYNQLIDREPPVAEAEAGQG